MKKKIGLTLLFVCSLSVATAQTAADSSAIVTADWRTVDLQKDVLYRKATFDTLYGVPQEVFIIELPQKHRRWNVLIHAPREETSVAARRSGAVVAINGSYFDMKEGHSVCYLRKNGVVVDTTAHDNILATIANGALFIRHGKLKLTPWNKQKERDCRLKRGVVLASGPLMLLDGKVCDFSACNPGFVNTKHPRSAVVLTTDKKILLIVVDGRRKGVAEGISIPHFAHLIRVLGGKDALNLDGGGSSTLWSVSLPGHGVANTPSGKTERKVANSLCVY